MAQEDKMRKVADAAVLLFVSRISTPLLVAVSLYIAHAVVDLQTGLAALSGSVSASVTGLSTRIQDLENWRDSMNYPSQQQRQNNN